MKQSLRFVLKTLLSLPLFGSVCLSAEPANDHGSTRVVFIGDSITGQGGGWNGAGFIFQMRDALRATYPNAISELVPLGGSGMGVNAWLELAKNANGQKRDLDVKGVEVAAALSPPADTMVIMLGMNDVLAPYVSDSDASLDQWLTNYRELVSLLRERLKPTVIALATITPQTEDPNTPMNLVLARMNQRIMSLANELQVRVVPTNAIYWEVLAEGRKTQADFTLAGDRIHPNEPGHMTVALAMLNSLGYEKAATWLREEQVAKMLDNLRSVEATAVSPKWLVTSGIFLRPWNEKPADVDLAPSPIDRAIEIGADFTQASAKEGGAPLTWRSFQSNIDLTDGASPGSVDFAGITFFQNFEAGYGARWIHSEQARRLKLDLQTSGVGSAIHLTVWLNGERLYASLVDKEPKRQTSREAELRAGWNVLVFKSCHRTWQWQQSINLTELDGSHPEGLQYSVTAPANATSAIRKSDTTPLSQ